MVACRPADRSKRIKAVGRGAFDLWDKLWKLDAWTREDIGVELLPSGERARYAPDTFLFEPGPLAEYKRLLADLEAACNAAIKTHQSSSSRGAPRKAASHAVVTQLRQVFAKNAREWSRDRPRRGAVNELSEYEAKEREFVILALDFAKIQKRDAIHEPTFRRYFRDKLSVPRKDDDV